MLKLRLWISLFLVMTLGSAHGSSLSQRSTPVVCEPPIVWHLDGDCLFDAPTTFNCTRPTISSGFDDLPHTRLAVQSTLMTEDGDRNNLWLGPGEVAGGANILHFCYQGESPIEWEIETQMNVLMNSAVTSFLCLEVIHAVSVGGLQTPMDQGPTCENTLETLGVSGTRQSFQSRAIRATTFTNGECYLPTVVEIFASGAPQNIVLTDFTATFTQKGCR